MTTQPADAMLHWTMRVIGLLLSATCIFLLTRDVGHSSEALWFLGGGTALGAITLVTSWLPTRSHMPEAKPVRA